MERPGRRLACELTLRCTDSAVPLVLQCPDSNAQADGLIAARRQKGVPSNHIALEITESTSLQLIIRLAEVLQRGVVRPTLQ